jgi:hypothetical protein
MVLDARRESAHIQREMARYSRQVGETVIWFQFDVVNSNYDSVYNESGRRWLRGIAVPTLWIDQGESPEQYMPEGRRTRVTLRFAVSAQAIIEAHIGLQEAHGHRVFDQGLLGDGWFDDRLNDIVYYDGRFWEVNNFQIRGRIRQDNVLGVTCTETYPEDEYTWDFPPASIFTSFNLTVQDADHGST